MHFQHSFLKLGQLSIFGLDHSSGSKPAYPNTTTKTLVCVSTSYHEYACRSWDVGRIDCIFIDSCKDSVEWRRGSVCRPTITDICNAFLMKRAELQIERLQIHGADFEQRSQHHSLSLTLPPPSLVLPLSLTFH